MAGSIALVGGDEFRSTCEEMDRHILTTIPRGSLPKVLIVPTAAASDNPVMAGFLRGAILLQPGGHS